MLVIPISSALYTTLQALTQTKRLIFLTGLPGTGKSLLTQQLALIGHSTGRQVHLLQYNTARQPFETAAVLAKYPENEGVTHAVIRKAVGLWAREAVMAWHDAHPGSEHLLVGELPLIGNRLLELTQVYSDGVEPLLASESAQFLVPVPSWEVREVIEQARARTIADPQHELEKYDAPPNVLHALWHEVNGLARELHLTKASNETPYNPYIYGGVYTSLLQERHHQTLLIDQILKPQQSVYALDVVTSMLQADEATAAKYIAKVEANFSAPEIRRVVRGWKTIVAQKSQPPDPGPELLLPHPESLLASWQTTDALSDAQRSGLAKLLSLPLEATADTVVPVLDELLPLFEPAGSPTPANVHKYDVYDGYFNVQRTADAPITTFLHGILLAYRNVMDDAQEDHGGLSVVELPLLRMGLETALDLYL